MSCAAPAVSYATSGRMPCSRRNASTCESAGGCERAVWISSSEAPGSASRQWLTRTTASARTVKSAWVRSRSYTSATAPACVFSTGTTAARTFPCCSAANTSSNVRWATSCSAGNRFPAAISEYAPGAPWYATFTLVRRRWRCLAPACLRRDGDEHAIVELGRDGAVVHRQSVRAVERLAIQRDAQLLEACGEPVPAGEPGDDDASGVPAHAVRGHNLVVQRVLEHAVLMDARGVRERVRADDGLVRLHRDAGELGEEPARRDDAV